MSLLAYDPERVGRLQRAMGEAADGLRAVSCTDPAAADAMRVVRATICQLDSTWLPLVTGLLSCDPLSLRQRRSERIDDLDQSLIRVMSSGYGWAVQHDPLSDDTATVTPQEARALGATLNEIDVTALVNDPVQLHWLARQLAIIGGDAGLSSQFLANFHEWARLCDGLGSERAHRLAAASTGGTMNERTAVVADLDAVFAGLADVQQHALPNGHTDLAAAVVVPQIDRMNPYSAALVVQHLRLDSTTLAFVTDSLLRRWWAEPIASGSDDPTTDADHFVGANTADVLFAALLCDAAACRKYMQLALPHLDTVFATADDPRLAFRVVLAGTAPSTTDAAVAGRIVLPVIEYFSQAEYRCDVVLCDGGGGEWRLFLADLVAPWLVQFTPLNEQFSDDPDRTKHALAFVFEGDAARARLLTDAASSTAGVRAAAGDDAARPQDIAAVVTMLYRLALETDVADEQARQQQFDSLATLASIAASAATGVAPVVGGAALLAGVVVDGGSASLQTVLSGNMFDPEGVEDDALYRKALALTAAATDVLAAAALQLVADGQLPPTVLPTPQLDLTTKYPDREFRHAYEAWANGHQIGGDTRALLDSAVNEFANAAMVSDSVYARA